MPAAREEEFAAEQPATVALPPEAGTAAEGTQERIRLTTSFHSSQLFFFSLPLLLLCFNISIASGSCLRQRSQFIWTHCV